MDKSHWRYVDEVRVEVWGGSPDVHLKNVDKEKFLDTMSRLWDSYQIDCDDDDGYEPGPIMLRMSIEPEAKRTSR